MIRGGLTAANTIGNTIVCIVLREVLIKELMDFFTGLFANVELLLASYLLQNIPTNETFNKKEVKTYTLIFWSNLSCKVDLICLNILPNSIFNCKPANALFINCYFNLMPFCKSL